MNPPWVYMCSPSWTRLPPPSPSHPSGSSQLFSIFKMIIIAIHLGVKWYLIVLDCISLTQVILNFHMLISHFYIFLGSSVHFSIGLLVFYYWVLEDFFFYKSRKKSFILYVCVCVLVTQLCPTLWDPMGCNSTVSSVCGIFQARILEWIAIPFSRESSWPRDWIHISCIGRWIFYQ